MKNENTRKSTREERNMSRSLAIRTQTIDLPAGRFHYVTWGAERTELPSMLLLHGITSSAQSWVRVGPELASGYRVYALDMRGHGGSIKPPPGVYSLRDTADDAVAFIEALRLERPVLIGHSWGGATAMVLASGAGSQKPVPAISHLILEDPAHAFGSGDLEERAAPYTRDIGRPAEELRAEIAASSPGWTEADIEGKIDALHKVSREAVVSVFTEAGQMGELLPLLASITAPTLLIRADPALGTTLDDAAWELARRVLPAGGRAVQIDGATHNIHRGTFNAFMQVVNDFLSQEKGER
jgi:pimeloyl-ACP methyl ester carboxylesterase